MRKQIRSNVFETNSSSMHSLVILKETKLEDRDYWHIWIGSDGVWDIWSHDLEFGRSPFCCLSTFEEKVRYAIASMCGYKDNRKETFENIKKIVFKFVPECKDIELPYDSWRKDNIYYGYVDEDILTEFLQKTNMTLEEFLINKNYIVIVDGDEYCIYNNMKRCGVIDTDNIAKEYSNYDDYGIPCY